jgi:hypothetical protein
MRRGDAAVAHQAQGPGHQAEHLVGKHGAQCGRRTLQEYDDCFVAPGPAPAAQHHVGAALRRPNVPTYLDAGPRCTDFEHAAPAGTRIPLAKSGEGCYCREREGRKQCSQATPAT